MELPLLRLGQAGSSQAGVVAAYYSTQLLGFVKDVLQVRGWWVGGWWVGMCWWVGVYMCRCVLLCARVCMHVLLVVYQCMCCDLYINTYKLSPQCSPCTGCTSVYSGATREYVTFADIIPHV